MPTKRIVLYCRDHGCTFTLENDVSEDQDVQVGGRTVKKQKVTGRRRIVVAKDHKIEVDDGPDIERLRTSDGYGTRFYEAIPDPGIPPGALSLWEMRRKHTNQFEARVQEMIKRGRGRISSVTQVIDHLDELYRLATQKKPA